MVYVPDQTAARTSTRSAMRELTAKERDSISVLVINPQTKDEVMNWLGGQWQQVGEPFGDHIQLGRAASAPMLGKKLTSYFTRQAPCARHQLEVFRRKTGASQATASGR